MKITSIEPIIVQVNHRGDWLFVHVHTDAGITGLGEASHSGSDALAVAALTHFDDQLRGHEAGHIEAAMQIMGRLNGGRAAQTALSAVEQALWDIVGQELGVPLHRLLGGALSERLRLYANINRHVRQRTPDGFAEAASKAVAEGFGVIKLAPFEVRVGIRRGEGLTRDPSDHQLPWAEGEQAEHTIMAAIDELRIVEEGYERRTRRERALQS